MIMKIKHPIFKAAVKVFNQEDCDKLREICEIYELPTWKDVGEAFRYVDYEGDQTYLKYDDNRDEDYRGFYVDNMDDPDEYNNVPVEYFEELANDYNPQFKTLEDVLDKLKQINNMLNP